MLSRDMKRSVHLKCRYPRVGSETHNVSTAKRGHELHASPIRRVTREAIEASVLGLGGFDFAFGEKDNYTKLDHLVDVWSSNESEKAFDLSHFSAQPNLGPFTYMNDVIANDSSTLKIPFDNAFYLTSKSGLDQSLKFFTDPKLITHVICSSQYVFARLSSRWLCSMAPVRSSVIFIVSSLDITSRHC